MALPYHFRTPASPRPLRSRHGKPYLPWLWGLSARKGWDILAAVCRASTVPGSLWNALPNPSSSSLFLFTCGEFTPIFPACQGKTAKNFKHFKGTLNSASLGSPNCHRFLLKALAEACLSLIFFFGCIFISNFLNRKLWDKRLPPSWVIWPRVI